MNKADTDIIRDFLMEKRKLDNEVYAAIRAMYLSLLVPKGKEHVQ